MCVYIFVFGCTVVLISVFLFQYFFYPPSPRHLFTFCFSYVLTKKKKKRSGEKLHLCISFRKKKSMFLFNWLQFSCTVRPSTKQLRFAPLVCRTTQDLVTCFPEGSRPLTRITENTSYALHNLPHKSNTPEIFITRPLMTLSTQSFKNISMCCE